MFSKRNNESNYGLFDSNNLLEILPIDDNLSNFCLKKNLIFILLVQTQGDNISFRGDEISSLNKDLLAKNDMVVYESDNIYSNSYLIKLTVPKGFITNLSSVKPNIMEGRNLIVDIPYILHDYLFYTYVNKRVSNSLLSSCKIFGVRIIHNDENATICTIGNDNIYTIKNYVKRLTWKLINKILNLWR